MSERAAFQRRLGYQFDNQALLRRALTHRSVGGEHNERLEYLGDSVLGLVMSEALYARFPGVDEGGLTQMRSLLVRREALAEQSRRLALGDCLRLGDSIRKSGGGGAGSESDALLANTLEAVIGALYLDSDWATVKRVLLALFAPQLAQISPYNPKDYKTRLQERLQKHGLPLPGYEVVGQSGAAHALTIRVECVVSGLAAPVTASGPSRRAAEQDAARRALALLDDADA